MPHDDDQDDNENNNNNNGEDTGLYIASTFVRNFVQMIPQMFSKSSTTGKVLEWGAPLLSNMVGMFVNLRMRKGLKQGKNKTNSIEQRVTVLEKEYLEISSLTKHHNNINT
jgi:hypothetical protein